LEAEGPERSSAESSCIVRRLRRLGRVGGLVVLVLVAFSSVGRQVEVLFVRVGCGRETGEFAVADVVDSPAVVCARGMVMRFGADMVVCVEVCGSVLALALKSGVVDDDGMGVESVVSRLERPALADGMFRECVILRCQGEKLRMSMGDLCSRARLRALSPVHAKACEWVSASELQVRESSHKAAVMNVIATRKSEVM
jgi:hypothetical protein